MLAIIGCGNLARTDDGVGVVVVHRLHDRFLASPPEGVGVFDAGTDGVAVMFRARGATEVLIVDACTSGSEPGAVFVVPADELGRGPPAALGQHEFRWIHAIEAGRQIFGADFPTRVTVWLIEAQSTAFGTELSDRVAGAVEGVVERIEARVRARG